MRKEATFGLLVLIGLCQLASSGCISHKAGETIGSIVVAKAMEQVFEAPMELTTSTLAFQQKNGRWPNDYAELRSFAATNTGASLTNYDRVDFTSKPDGSVAILAVAPGVSNRMTLSITNKSGN